MDFRVKVTGVDALAGKLKDLAANQLPYATKEALNATAEEIQKAEIEKMKEVFDRPTPFTLGSTFVKYATKANLKAEVGFREFAGKGTPAWKYLSPQVVGGDRNLKPFEKAMQAKGILPPGLYAVPGKGASLNTSGNMSTGQIVQILSYFETFGEQGYRANITPEKKAKMAKGSKKAGSSIAYFVSRGKGSVAMTGKTQHLPPGIYARYGFSFGSAIKCIIAFVKKPTYQKRFPFEETAAKCADRVFMVNLSTAIDKAVKTAK